MDAKNIKDAHFMQADWSFFLGEPYILRQPCAAWQGFSKESPMPAGLAQQNDENPLRRRGQAEGQGWVQFRKAFPTWNPPPPSEEIF
jgi:hypothetical protein